MGYEEFLATGNIITGDLKCKVLEALIINKTLIAQAETDSVYVEEDQVDAELDRRIQYVLQGRDPSLLEQQYGKTLAEIKDELRNKIKEELIIQKMRRMVTSEAKITPTEVKKFFKTLASDSLPYFSAEVEVGQIVVLPKVNPVEKTRIKNQLEQIKKDILEGKSSFSDMARKYSEDPGSAKQGGELDFFSRGDLVPEYEGAALSLAPQEISDVVETKYGFHIIQMIERRGNRFNSRHILIKPKAAQKNLAESARFLDSLKVLLIEGKHSFEKLASKYSEDPYTSPNGGFFVNQSTGTTQMPTQQLEPSLYFIIDTMQVVTYSEPVPYQTNDGEDALRLIYYKSKINPHEANLTDDYQKLQNAALEAKKSKLLSDWFEETRGDIYLYIEPDYQHCDLK